MLFNTQELIKLINFESQEVDHTLLTSHVHAILQCGNTDDAQALLKQFLENPSEHRNTYTFPIIASFGNIKDAEAIFNVCFKDSLLLEEIFPEVLELLGKLQYEPIKPILIQYGFSSSDYYLSKHALLGLLNFDCSDIEQFIIEEIKKVLKQPIFPEFIPAFVCKVQNKTQLLQELFDFGASLCSTDCNAGIILGFSLCGEEGLPYFKKALIDPSWEIYATGTGTVNYAFLGMLNLGLTFDELFQDVKLIQGQEQLAYALTILLALLEAGIKQPGNQGRKEESYQATYLSLFSKEDDNIIDLCSRVDLQDEAYRLQDLVELKIREEAILLSIKSY